MKQLNRNNVIILSLGIVLILTIIISFRIGRYSIFTNELLGILFSKIIPIDPFGDIKIETVLFNVRLPRIALACLVGCCLSAAGAAYQGVFQNPMAAPDILGASAGAAFGAALAILNYGSSFIVTLYAFGFSLLTVALVYLISKKAVEYYKLFYHSDLTQDQYNKLVANSLGKTDKK
ncbi:iron chelate uptake ABC transporter family permease subunit [Acetobacterium carbinolicum]|uniref:iron chelate uptake ABC transporter family permease subunit n=1 Tax=Acetobacterium carbinolicum TaxID=52690 RepID=UPI0039C9C4C3